MSTDPSMENTVVERSPYKHPLPFVNSLEVLCCKSLMTHTRDCILCHSRHAARYEQSFQSARAKHAESHARLCCEICFWVSTIYTRTLGSRSVTVLEIIIHNRYPRLPFYQCIWCLVVFPIKPALQHQHQMCIVLFPACLFKCQTRLQNNPSKTNISTAFALTCPLKISIRYQAETKNAKGSDTQSLNTWACRAAGTEQFGRIKRHEMHR